MTENKKLREVFEARMTDNGKWPRAVEQGRNGCYLLAQTENAWAEWQACAEALALPTAEQVDDINVAESFTSVTKTAAPAQGEPFGYFRAEPFGWTDCPEDAEGAIALYEHPAKPAQEVGLTDDEIDENTVWHDPDPHDNVHCDVSATVRKCLAAIRAKGGK